MCRRRGNEPFKATGRELPDGNASEGHHGWEELVYWLRGYGDLGCVLNDPAIIAETRVWIKSLIASLQLDGYFGPKQLQTREKGKLESWVLLPRIRSTGSLMCHFSHNTQRAEELYLAK